MSTQTSNKTNHKKTTLNNKAFDSQSSTVNARETTITGIASLLKRNHWLKSRRQLTKMSNSYRHVVISSYLPYLQPRILGQRSQKAVSNHVQEFNVLNGRRHTRKYTNFTQCTIVAMGGLAFLNVGRELIRTRVNEWAFAGFEKAFKFRRSALCLFRSHKSLNTFKFDHEAYLFIHLFIIVVVVCLFSVL